MTIMLLGDDVVLLGERLTLPAVCSFPVGKRCIQAHAVHPGGEFRVSGKTGVRSPKLVHHLLYYVLLIVAVSEVGAGHFPGNATVRIDVLNKGVIGWCGERHGSMF
jgi:hypothetical protein